MGPAVETLADKLEAALGKEAVREDPAVLHSHTVDGMAPRVYCAPADPAQVADAVRVCAEAGAAIVPWGGGTSMRLGNLPRRVDAVLGLERVKKLVEHDDANLTATLQAGMTLSAIQDALAPGRQFLAIDPPNPRRATIGGIVAANTNGPRRMAYGGVRDQVIGMKMVLASGEQIKAGGKVVKNVAGYDMCKLFVGSLGTLGIITEVTFRLAPQPETFATVVATGTLEKVMQTVAHLRDSPLLPAAASVLAGLAIPDARVTAGQPALAIWIEGFDEAVRRQIADLTAMATEHELEVQVLTDAPHLRLWDAVRDVAAGESGVLYRVTVPLATVEAILMAIVRDLDPARDRCVVHVGTGTLWVVADVAAFPALRSLAQQHGGHTIMAAAPPEAKAGVDVWGPAAPGLAIMRKIKTEFDPNGILNPGRFVSGL